MFTHEGERGKRGENVERQRGGHYDTPHSVTCDGRITVKTQGEKRRKTLIYQGFSFLEKLESKLLDKPVITVYTTLRTGERR